VHLEGEDRGGLPAIGCSGQGGPEDIAAAGSILQAYAMFRTSATHWSNIIYPSFSQIGVAVVQTQYGEIVDILFSGSQI
jgi:hypothetical protein